eukprot:Colp12_sorted_trinity150504_noHs@29642
MLLGLSELQLLEYTAWGMIATAVIVAIALTFRTAPYGRYQEEGWGIKINGKLAWIVQEAPAFCIPLFLTLRFVGDLPLANRLLLGIFMLHYFHRTFIFPLRIRGGKPTPFMVFFMAYAFCVLNGYMQGRYLTEYARYPEDWIQGPRFILGLAVFFTGMAINIHSDSVLINLRKPGETGYKIPKGGMFEYVSGANFFGEIVEWTGFAIASWNVCSFAFALFTACNIAPRAYQHHKWYLGKFKEEYPKARKAVFPFLL